MPRVHGAYDLFGDGKTVIKGGFGRFANLRDLSPELTRLAKENAQMTTWTWRDLNNNRDYDPGEVDLNPNGNDFRSIAGVTNAVVNPDEPQPKSDEWSLTFERELMWNWALRGTGVYATNFDLRRLAEPRRPRSAYNIPVTNVHPGIDGLPGTADDPGTTITYWEYPAEMSGVAYAGTMIVPADGKQTFKTIEVAGTRRISGGWQAAVSISATKANVPFNDEQADNPNTEINSYQFNVGNDDQAVGRVHASVRGDHVGHLRAPERDATGGEPSVLGRPGYYADRAEHRPDRHHQPARDEPLEHALRETGSFRRQAIEARFDFFNIFNTNFVTGRTTRVGPSYLVPSSTILPRILQMDG